MSVPPSFSLPGAMVHVLADIVGAFEPKLWTEDTLGAWYTDLGSWEPCRVDDDGTSLTEAASLSACRSTDGSWYWDEDTGCLYLNPTASINNPYASQLQVFVIWRFATSNREYDGKPYEARLSPKNFQAINTRVNARFGGNSRLSGATVELINLDDLFGVEEEMIDWDAGWVNVRLAADERR